MVGWWLFVSSMFLLGLLTVVFVHRKKARLLAEAGNVPGLTPELRKHVLFQPYTELLIDYILTFAGLFFASKVFYGWFNSYFTYFIGILCATLSSWGANTRFLHVWREAKVKGKLKDNIRACHRHFCYGVWLMLVASVGVLLIIRNS